MPSLICPIFKKRKKKHSGHDYTAKRMDESFHSTTVLGDADVSPRFRDAPMKHSGKSKASSSQQQQYASRGHNVTAVTPLSLKKTVTKIRDDDCSLPTIDPDYNPTSDNFSLSDAGGTIGSQSLSTTIFGAQTRHSNASINYPLERGLYNTTTNNKPYYNNEHYYQKQQYTQQSKLLEVYAPAGKLGIVIDVPLNSTTPIVHAIKDTCPIRNELLVGDQLLAVDEDDVRNMSATEVSRLISRKSGQDVRKLTLMRGGVTRHSVW